MPKKGVFGSKAMPMDSVRGMATAPKPQKRDPEVRIRKINGGYLVSCSPETAEEYKDADHAKETLDAALETAKSHLEGKKEEKKD